MKLSEILMQVNTFEKNHFLRILDQIISTKPKNYPKIEKILDQIDGHLKNADNNSVAEVLSFISNEFTSCIEEELGNATSQLDICIDILLRDGNTLMKREWFMELYEKEVKKIASKSKSLYSMILQNDDSSRIRDYRIYQACVKTAYHNDELQNRDNKVTYDEQSILNSLIDVLELSHEEVKLINYTVIPLKKIEIDDLITYLVKSGIILYSRKNHQIFVPDEIVEKLRVLRHKEVSDKVFRRVLRHFKDSQINLVARKHNIDYKLDRYEKIKEIIKEGIKFSTVLLKSAHKDGATKTDRKEFLQYLIDKMSIKENIRGASLEDKYKYLAEYFNKKDKDDNISISIHGYDKLLIDLSNTIKGFQNIVFSDFEIQKGIQLDAKKLIQYNIKPIDILYVLEQKQINEFCSKMGISIRGNEIQNILEKYKDVQNLYLENYIAISNRDLNLLKSNNIEIKESELGIRFEELTKLIFSNMNLNVDSKLQKALNNNKNKVDIVINLEDNDIMIFECKSKKDRSFKNYSSLSRQIKSYKSLAEQKGYNVVKSFLIAPEFTDDFENECGLDYELNLSLMTSSDLLAIYQAFTESKLEEFPYKILFRDVKIDPVRVIKALKK